MTNPANIDQVITTYKGFDSDLKCRGFQYAVGKTYEHEGEVEARKGGFHACEHPLNVFDYYAPSGNRFAMVEQSGVLIRHDDDTKVASSRISIKAEIGIAGLVKAAVEYVSSRCLPIDPESPASATGYQGAASATGSRRPGRGIGHRRPRRGDVDRSVRQSQRRCWKRLFLVHRNDSYEITHAAAAIVGQGGIKPDVFYTLSDTGEFIEVVV